MNCGIIVFLIKIDNKFFDFHLFDASWFYICCNHIPCGKLIFIFILSPIWTSTKHILTSFSFREHIHSHACIFLSAFFKLDWLIHFVVILNLNALYIIFEFQRIVLWFGFTNLINVHPAKKVIEHIFCYSPVKYERQ